MIKDPILSVFFHHSADFDQLTKEWGSQAKKLWTLGQLFKALHHSIGSILTTNPPLNQNYATAPVLPCTSLTLIARSLELLVCRPLRARLASLYDNQCIALQTRITVGRTSEYYSSAQSVTYVFASLAAFEQPLRISLRLLKALWRASREGGTSVSDRELACRKLLARFAVSGAPYQKRLCASLCVLWTRNALYQLYTGITSQRVKFRNNAQLLWFVSRHPLMLMWEGENSRFGKRSSVEDSNTLRSLFLLGQTLCFHWDFFYIFDASPSLYEGFLDAQAFALVTLGDVAAAYSAVIVDSLLFLFKTLQALNVLSKQRLWERLDQSIFSAFQLDTPSSFSFLPDALGTTYPVVLDAHVDGFADITKYQTEVSTRIKTLHGEATQAFWTSCTDESKPESPMALFFFWTNFLIRTFSCAELHLHSQAIRFYQKSDVDFSGTSNDMPLQQVAHRSWEEAVKTSIGSHAIALWTKRILLHPLPSLFAARLKLEHPSSCACPNSFFVALEQPFRCVFDFASTEQKASGYSKHFAFEIEAQAHWGEHRLCSVVVVLFHVQYASGNNCSVFVDLYRPQESPATVSQTHSASRLCVLSKLGCENQHPEPSNAAYYRHVKRISSLEVHDLPLFCCIEYHPDPPSLNACLNQKKLFSKRDCIFCLDLPYIRLLPRQPHVSQSKFTLHGCENLIDPLPYCCSDDIPINPLPHIDLGFPFVPIPVLPPLLHMIYAKFLSRGVRLYTLRFAPLVQLLNSGKHQLLRLARQSRRQTSSQIVVNDLKMDLYRSVYAVYSVCDAVLTYAQRDVVQVESQYLKNFHLEDDTRIYVRERKVAFVTQIPLEKELERFFATVERRLFFDHPPLQDLLYLLMAAAFFILQLVSRHELPLSAEQTEEVCWKTTTFFADLHTFDQELLMYASITRAQLPLEALHQRLYAVLSQHHYTVSKSAVLPSSSSSTALVHLMGRSCLEDNCSKQDSCDHDLSLPPNSLPVTHEFKQLSNRLAEIRLKFNHTETGKRLLQRPFNSKNSG